MFHDQIVHINELWTQSPKQTKGLFVLLEEGEETRKKEEIGVSSDLSCLVRRGRRGEDGGRNLTWSWLRLAGDQRGISSSISSAQNWREDERMRRDLGLKITFLISPLFLSLLILPLPIFLLLPIKQPVAEWGKEPSLPFSPLFLLPSLLVSQTSSKRQ